MKIYLTLQALSNTVPIYAWQNGYLKISPRGIFEDRRDVGGGGFSARPPYTHLFRMSCKTLFVIL